MTNISESAREMGKKGSKSLLQKYGNEYMKELGRKSGEARRAKKLIREREQKEKQESEDKKIEL